MAAERQIAALGSDGNNDTAPSVTDGVDFPVHVLAVNALGLHLMDYLEFSDLAPLCEQQGRWSFLCVIAPLRLPTGTGSPVNPIAIVLRGQDAPAPASVSMSRDTASIRAR